MKINTLLFFTLLSWVFPVFGVFANNKTIIKGKFNNCRQNHSKIWIYSFHGTNLLPLDTTKINKNGTFEFDLVLPKHSGYYRISISKTNYIDVILTAEENPVFTFESCDLNNWTNIEGSLENKILLESKKLSLAKKGDTDLLKEIAILANKNNATFFSRTTLGYLPLLNIVPDTFETYVNKINYITEHYFDNVNFSNSDIINSTLLPNIYMRYLEQYTEYNEDGFKKSIDQILKHAQENEFVYTFSLDFLITLFKKTGPEIILEYIVENYYFKYSCGSNEDLSDETKKIIGSYSSLLTGSQMPDLKFLSKGSSSDSLLLSGLFKKNKLTALIFWSSYCHYCEIKSPEWNKIYQNFKTKGLEILFISLDTDEISLEKGIREKKLDGIHTCDKKGWNGDMVEKLNVNRTPYIYLVSTDGKIILKDPSVEQLKTFIENYLQ
jgi:thiol-disulfide isomerase/thioredoxin